MFSIAWCCQRGHCLFVGVVCFILLVMNNEKGEVLNLITGKGVYWNVQMEFFDTKFPVIMFTIRI